jgi:8-oxo-dGTP diphosphatase
MKLAVLCYLNSGGKTLMIHRNSAEDDMHYGKWNAPGGKIEPGETPDECVVREFHEETGLTVKDPLMRGVLTFPAFDGQEDWYVFVFTASSFTGTLKKSCPEGDLAWIDQARLNRLSLWEGDLIFMKWLDDPRFWSGKFIYDPSGFKGCSVVFHERKPV